MSGLQINASKSALYMGGRNQQLLEAEALAQGLQVDTLPIRYLGLPLTTRSMTSLDYAPLIDKIRTRLLSWTTKSLSYKPLSSVITSISSFWCSVFRLPVRCFEEVEKLCGAFLWTGNPNTSTGAKVSWEEVCKPKSEGGLGIRRLKDVSWVFSFRLIWRLFTTSGSLWVAWIRQNLMKRAFFWTAPTTTLGSWVWRKLLKIREEFKHFIRVEVHDGASTSFWYDHWLPMGRIIDITGPSSPRILGVPITATVKEAMGPSGWRVRRTRQPHLIPLIAQIRAQPLPIQTAGPDQFLWRHGTDDFRPTFSTKLTWEQIRTHSPVKNWSKVVWFKHGIPRCSFITWLAVRNRLSTGDRMRAWGSLQPCILRGEPDETREHLFFACPFSFTLWSEVAGKLLRQRQDPDWDISLAQILTGTGNVLNDILLRLCFQITVYYIWRERNSRIHSQRFSTVHQLTRQIDRLVRNRIASLNYTTNPQLRDILQKWFAAAPTMLPSTTT